MERKTAEGQGSTFPCSTFTQARFGYEGVSSVAFSCCVFSTEENPLPSSMEAARINMFVSTPPWGARAARAVHQTGREKPASLGATNQTQTASPKEVLQPSLAAHLVEVIFIVREPLKEKATCSRKGNKRMCQTGRKRELDERIPWSFWLSRQDRDLSTEFSFQPSRSGIP